MATTLKSRQKNAETRAAIAKSKMDEARYKAFYEIIEDRNKRKRRQTRIEMASEDRQMRPESRLAIISIARDLWRNNPQAKGMLRQLWLNVVGTGPKVNFHTKDKEWNLAAEAFWNTSWAKRSDARGRIHIGQKLGIAFLSMLIDGDVLCWFDDETGKVMWWEADQLTKVSEKNFKKLVVENQWKDDDGDFVQVDGMVCDKKGRIQFFAVGAGHGKIESLPKEVTYLPEADCRLLADPWRCNQKRGQSDIITCAADLMDIKEMKDHELQSAKVACAWAMKVKRDDALEEAIARSDRPETSPDVDQPDLKNLDRFEKITGGAIEYLEPGEDVETIKNERPSAQIEPFFEFLAGTAGASMGLPKLFTMLKADKSYSAARAENNIAEKIFDLYQKLLERNQYDFLVEKSVAYAIRTKKLPKNKDWVDKWSFTHPKLKPIDSTREAKANRELVASGFKDLRTIIGPRWRETLEALGDQKKLAEEMGLNLESFPGGKPAAGPQSPILDQLLSLDPDQIQEIIDAQSNN